MGNNITLSNLLTYLLTYSIKHCPSSETNRFAASQKIPCILCNPNVHYLIHNSPPPVTILSQIDPLHTLKSHFLNIHLSIIPIHAWVFQVVLSLSFSHQNPLYTSAFPYTCYIPRPSYSSRFVHIKILGEQYRSLSSTDN